MQGAHGRMQHAHSLELKMESQFANQFNDSEYQRWLTGIRASRTLGVPLGIASFLDPKENLQPGREDLSMSSVEIGKE
jgi:hypothetical protein